MNSEKLSVKEKIGYGMGDAASNIVFQTVMMFLTFYYTDIFGLSAAAVGTMFLAVRVLDAVTDPLMGALADRTETRWGKFRPYLLWLAIPYALICVLTFTTPDLGPTGKLVYAYITYAALMIVYTAINIPYCALGGVLTDDPHERVSIQSYRFVLATAAGVMVSALTLPLVDWLGGDDKARGYQAAIAMMSTLGVVLFLVCFATTRERVHTAVATSRSIRDDLKGLWQNDQWRLVAGLSFIIVIGVIIRASVSLYYINYVVGRPDLATAFITTGMIGMMLGSGFAKPAADRYQKSVIYSYSNVIIATLCIAFFFIDPTAIALVFLLHFAIGFVQQLTTPILWAMLSDTVDYGEWKNGERITGLTFSSSLFALKMGMALAGAMAGWMLAGFGYQGGVEQSDSALFGITLLFTLIPACGAIIGAIVVRRYRLDDTKLAQVHSDLQVRQLQQS